LQARSIIAEHRKEEEEVLAAKDEKLMDLVNTSVDLVVQDEEDQELLHFCYSNVQLLIKEKMGEHGSLINYRLPERGKQV